MRLIRQLLGAVLGAMILVSALVGAAAPASAHDAAESTSPAPGATVAMPPEKVSITFNKNPLTLGSQIVVTDAAGNSWAEGNVEIVDNVASQALKPGAPAGAFTVAWRVVSSDSHPIEGSFSFTATAGASGSTAAPVVPTLTTPQPGVTGTSVPLPDAAEPFPWSLVIFVGTAVGILVTLALMAKWRLTPGGEGNDVGERDDRVNDDGVTGPDAGGAGERSQEQGSAGRIRDGER
ncbi:methionine-rich copper-binding protein CopC [Arthrobacter sp. V4I6]|uniref:copper resistance CopC family protein n=1 Tax=unclassified Arthrobacter TaxID=235627 RepID=UPI0027814EA4|nr:MULTISPECIES: copper resistance CopC family protein [unclassified Arthrobacter]MDQ0823006.1 methionine-rich copper-binding protein CopC [Arthrobacter sp. V1I7]MDQ0852633.1 methionine-rich copper-binding protein CopC [Arthrobacter sp. V4I6]